MIATIQRAHDMGAHTTSFPSFRAGSTMESHPQPSYGHYRRVQLARYIINRGHGRSEGWSTTTRGRWSTLVWMPANSFAGASRS